MANKEKKLMLDDVYAIKKISSRKFIKDTKRVASSATVLAVLS